MEIWRFFSFFFCTKGWGFPAVSLIAGTGKVKNKLIDCLPSPPSTKMLFLGELHFIKVITRAGNVITHWYTLIIFLFFFSPSNILSQVFSEALSVSHHTCANHINSFHHSNWPRTDIPMRFRAAVRMSGVPAAQSHVPAYVVRAPSLFGAQFPFRVLRWWLLWWGKAVTLFEVSNLLHSSQFKLAI